jgi:ABC-type transport system substrate-binding protein
MPGYEPGLGREYSYDIEKARSLLEQAGFPGGQGFPPVFFQFDDTPTGRGIASFVRGQLRPLGLEVKLEPLETDAYAQVMRERRYTLTYLAWAADYAHQEALFLPLFTRLGSANYAGYQDSAIEELIGQARRNLDPLEGPRLWAEVHRRVLADLPLIPLVYPRRSVLVKPFVRGLRLTPLDGAVPGELLLSQVYIRR